MPAASARLSTSTAARTTKRSGMPSPSSSGWNTGPARTPPERRATASASFCRSPTPFSAKSFPSLTWAKSGTTASACFSSPRRSCAATRQKRCLRSSSKKAGWSLSAGGRSRSTRTYWASAPAAACPPSGRGLSAARKVSPGGLTSTGSCISSAGNLSSRSRRPTSPASPAGRSSIRGCSWSASCGSSI